MRRLLVFLLALIVWLPAASVPGQAAPLPAPDSDAPVATVVRGDVRATAEPAPAPAGSTVKARPTRPIDRLTQLADPITSPAGDSLEITNMNVAALNAAGDSMICGTGAPTWVGANLGYCAFLAIWDAELQSGTPPATNYQSDITWDACGNQVLSGSTQGWHVIGTDHIDGLAGSRVHTVPQVPSGCYGEWLVEYTFTQTFTSGESLTVVGYLTYQVFRSEADAVAAQNAQQTPTGGPVGPDEQLGSCGESRSTHTQATDYPVDTATGNFWHTFTDLTIPGRGPAVAVERTYNSRRAAIDSVFGFGWSDRYGERLEIDADRVVLHGCKGSLTEFTLTNGDWQAPPRVLGDLVHNADGTWTYSKAATDTYTFDAEGRLTSIADRNGETTRVSYPDAETRLVTDAAGRTVTFELDAGRITSLHDSASPARTVSYRYDGAGNLTDVIDVAGGHWEFTYDDEHRMLTMRSPRFHGVEATPAPVVANHYDAQGRVDWQSDQLGRRTTFDYTTVPGSTIVTDPAGNATQYDYQDGLLVFEIKGLGSSKPSYWLYRYDPATLGRTLVVDGNGNRTRATYEPDGDRATYTDALGRTTRFTYNAAHQVTSITSPRRINGREIRQTFTYENGNLATASAPLLAADGTLLETATTTYEHGDPSHPGDVTAVVDPLEHRTVNQYDRYGNLASVTTPASPDQPDGSTTTYTYEPVTGWLTAITSPRGNVPGADPGRYTTRFGHNAYGQLTWTRDPLWEPAEPTAHQTVNSYDADGNLEAITDGNGNTSRFVHNAAGEPISVERPDGSLTSTTYWPDGNVKEQTDAAGNTTGFVYDSHGRLTTITDPLNRTTRFTRDSVGNVVSVADPGGRRISYTYDDGNQLRTVSYSSGGPSNVTDISYDADGRRISATDGTGTATWAFDSLGRLTSATDAAGATTSYGYDLAGRQTSVAYPGSAGTVRRTFDDANRIVAIEDLSARISTFSYDPDSHLVGSRLPNGTATTYRIDPAGQVEHIRHVRQATPEEPFAAFEYTYDGAGLVKGVNSSGVVDDDHNYEYDALNRLGAVDGATIEYDPAGNLTGRLDGLTQSYDAARQLRSLTGAAIERVGTASAAGTSSAVSVPLPQGWRSGDQAVVAVSMPESKNVSTFTGYTLRATYTTGERKSGKILVYTRTLTTGDTDATLTVKGKFGKSIAVAVYRNVDPTSPVKAVAGAATTGTSLSIGSLQANRGEQLLWMGGATGEPGTWTVPDGMTLRESTADGTSDVVVADQPVVEDGATGPRTASRSVAGSLSGALLSLKPAGTDFSYSPRGQRTSWTDPTGSTVTNTFDTAGQLASHGGATTYTYDLDGLRTSKTSSGIRTSYTWDPTTANPRLLSDGVTSFVYGPTGAPLAAIGSDGHTEYHQQDLLGSTRALTDDSGNVQATYTYDPFGAVTSSTGTSTNPLGYAGQYTDAESGYVYLRTRYYDPATASFISRDPLEIVTGSPYGYAADNPVNLTDPSGACPICVVLIGAAAGAAIDLGAQALVNVISGCDPLHDVSWGQVAFSGFLGAVPGGIALGAGRAAAKTGITINLSTAGRTVDEAAAIREYAVLSNAWLARNGPSTIQSTSGALHAEAKAAARAERLRAARAGTPYTGQAGHVPDTAITGQANPPGGWLDMPGCSNQVCGGVLGSRVGQVLRNFTVDGRSP